MASQRRLVINQLSVCRLCRHRARLQYLRTGFISAVHTLRMASEPVIEQKGEMHLAWVGLLAIFLSAGTALPVVKRSTNGEVFALHRSMTFPQELGDDVDTSDDEIKNLGKCK